MALLTVDSTMNPLILKIRKTIADHKMIEPGDCVLLGVSGGPDSVVLLQSLFALKDELGIELGRRFGHASFMTRGTVERRVL